MSVETWSSLRKELKTSEGTGGQSTIKINKDKTIIKKKYNKDELKYYFIEKDILLSLDHPNIIQIEKYEDENISLYYKYYKKGSAFKKYINNNNIQIENIDTILKLFNEILNALIYLKNNNITHRDIKLENILINNNDEHVLCDFGLSRRSLTKMKKICGTYNYMAPEMWFLNKEENKTYDYKVDIFSLGSLIIEIVNGKSPFYDEYRCRFKKVYKELNRYIVEDEEKIFEKIWYSTEKWINLRKIIIQMINPTPDNRIDYYEIKKLLDII